MRVFPVSSGPAKRGNKGSATKRADAFLPDGHCEVVSTARLKDEFYGLPARENLLRARLVKEAAHELGHTFGLRHCMDWRCVMASSHAVERLDIKGAEFCNACRKPVTASGPW